MKRLICFFLNFCVLFSVCGNDSNDEKQPFKVIICGVCKNIGYAAHKTIENIETLGSRFADYSAIIYENNSTDDTVPILKNWANENPRVTFISEILSESELATIRTVNIARARNKILAASKNPEFQDYPYLIMVDLDFLSDWPFDAVVETLKDPREWDCVCANSVMWGPRIPSAHLPPTDIFYDRYAFRDKNYPFGVELLGDDWWTDLLNRPDSWFKFDENKDDWIPIYAGYGGMAIYKTSTVVKFKCGGVVTEDVKKFYQRIFSKISYDHPDFQRYLMLNKLSLRTNPLLMPVIFRENTLWEHSVITGKVSCCDNIPLQASMTVNGYKKFYINPKLVMRY